MDIVTPLRTAEHQPPVPPPRPDPDPADQEGSGTPEEFFLPPLPRLLPVAYHPRAAKIEFLSNGWVRHHLGACFPDEDDLLRFLRQRNGLYGPLTVPSTAEERALNIANFYQFVTVIDSFTADRTALGASHHRAREAFSTIMANFGEGAGTSTDLPYARAGEDLWRRISPDLTAGQVERFRASLDAFLRGCATEVVSQISGDVPDLGTYLAVRTDSFGCDFLALLTEYAAAVDMTAFTGLPEFAVLHAHCMHQLIIVNDLLSWRKEHALHDTMNAVRVLQAHEGLTMQGAVDRLCQLVEHHERSYIAARDRILVGPLGERPDVRAYLQGLDDLIAGSQEFEYLTPRYFGDGYVWDGSTWGWISLTAPVTRFSERPGAAGGTAAGLATSASAATR